MTCSKLTDAWLPVPGKSYSPRAYPVTRVTVHHIAGDPTIEGLQDVFLVPGRQASSNYGVGSDGRIGCYVAEEDGAWTSSSWDNDNRAITIEVADADTVNWIPSDSAYKATVALCADICNRYGITPTYTGDTGGTFTEHMMFAATGCPGPWWHAHMPQFINDVKQAMEGDDMATPADMWGYNWENTAPGGNMYNCVVGLYKKVEELASDVKVLSAKVDKIQVGGVDRNALKKDVADEIAARMKS